ncbi:MAG: LysM peptidoglycan-binding domain-containing protein [Prevotellaceae bacterium]|jgi:LysM repeat protein|nr:LysM peptidoglycan-binding domain-containing protein [Prevotellaceae bacterium]
MKLIFAIFLLLLCSTLSAQPQEQPPVITRSSEILTDGNHRYYLHAVKQGETIYSLCRAYVVSQEELLRDNPALSGGLKAGQWLQIRLTPVNGAAHFIRHIAQPKETIYSIARTYGVSVGNILAANPGVAHVLPVNAVLYIPASDRIAPDKSVATAAASGGETGIAGKEPEVTLIEHVAQRKETLFSISNLYEIDMDFIKQYNPQIFTKKTAKIKVGQIVYIPIMMSGLKKSSALQHAAAPLCDSSGYRDPINVAILLPFGANSHESEDDLYKSFRFVEMYEGALLALETLSKRGISVNLSVLDFKSMYDKVGSYNAALDKADIIIGPVYQSQFIPVAKFAKTKGIKIVSPLTPIDTSLYGYANVFQVATDFNSQVQKALTHAHLNPEHSNIILVSQRDEEASQKLRNLYRQYLPKRDSIVYHNLAGRGDSLYLEMLRKDYETRVHAPTVKNLSYQIGIQPRENQETFLKIFLSGMDNKVVVASQDEPFVSELLANLKAFSNRYKCNITVYGSSDWRKYEKVELDLFYELKLHVAVPYFIDYRSEAVKSFVESYRYAYKTEPSQFAFQGYDVMLYFVSAIHRYGKNFEGCLPFHREELLQSTYNFVPTTTGGAYENKGVFLLRYTPWLEILQYR